MIEQFEPLLSAAQAAPLLGLHKKTIQGMARSGEIPCLRMGKYWKFRESSLDAWVKDTLAPKSKSHLKRVMHLLFERAMLWGLVEIMKAKQEANSKVVQMILPRKGYLCLMWGSVGLDFWGTR